MKTYVALFMLAAGLSSVLTPLVRRSARRWGVVDQPDERRIHRQPVPRLGGVAIYAALLVSLTSLFLSENLVATQFKAELPRVARLLIPATLILLLGVYDDLRGANAPVKFSVQIVAAGLLYFLGFQVTRVWNPLGGTIELGVFALPITILWLVGITNAFNLIDGLDGLSAGAAFFATLALFTAALVYHQPLVVVMTIALTGSILGFLRYNSAPASIFLGDSGSLFLGFILAALSVEGSQKSTTAIAVAIPLASFGLPIVDTFWTLIRRGVSKKPLFIGDLEHIHHMMLKRGLSMRQVIILLYAVCAGFALFSLLFLNPQGKLTGLVLFVIGISVFFGIRSLGYHEFSEMVYSVGKVFRHHHVLAKNVHLRRAMAELNQARSADEILLGLTRVVETDEFDGLEIKLTTDLKFELDNSADHQFAFHTRNGLAVWSWRREDLHANSTIPKSSGPEGATHFWSIQLPLISGAGRSLGDVTFYRDFARGPLQIDVDHLCSLFQKELSQALERVEATPISVKQP
jgi:UDP-GlcNAc:undecaprenyl-phosphate GlcNAc-1-phosphate transferase